MRVIMDENEVEKQGSRCSSLGCQKKIDSDQMDGFFLFLARNIFGPFGGRLTEGYCVFCKKRNLSRAFLFLIVLFSFIVAIIELPWKGPIFAFIMILVWVSLLGKWAFGVNR